MAERVPSGVVLVSAGVLVLARSKRSFGQREKGANFDKAAADDRPLAQRRHPCISRLWLGAHSDNGRQGTRT